MQRDDEKPEPPESEDAERNLRQKLEGLIPEVVRRTVAAGLGAALATEEGIRRIAAEIPVPKEVATYLLNTADNTKDKIFEIVAREVREFLQNLNLNDVLVKTLTQLSFEIKTEIRFIPNDEAVSGVKPDVKRKVSVKRTRDDGSSEPID